jgi:transposase
MLMTTPGVRAIVCLTFVTAIDDASRFKSSKRVGAHFGLTPKPVPIRRNRRDGMDLENWRSVGAKCLYEAAHAILTHPIKGAHSRAWAMKFAQRAGMKKAKVALARKLAVVLHRMLADGVAFRAAPAQRRARRVQGRSRAACGG